MFELTVPVMAGLLVTLIVIYLRLNIGRGTSTAREKWLVHIPFSVYLGWITVATVANVTDLLYYWGWSGWGIYPEAWAAIMLISGAAIAATVSLTRADLAYTLVIVWAYIGIVVKQANTPIVAGVAGIAVLVVMLVWVSAVVRRARRAQPQVALPRSSFRKSWSGSRPTRPRPRTPSASRKTPKRTRLRSRTPSMRK